MDVQLRNFKLGSRKTWGLCSTSLGSWRRSRIWIGKNVGEEGGFFLFEREKSPTCWFIPRMPTMGRTRPESKPRAGNTTQVSDVGGRSSVTWATTYWLSKSALAGNRSWELEPRLRLRYASVGWGILIRNWTIRPTASLILKIFKAEGTASMQIQRTSWDMSRGGFWVEFVG